MPIQARSRKVIGYTVGTIGLISSLIGIWAFFYKPLPDNEIVLLPKAENNIVIKQQSDVDDLPNPIKANTLIIDGSKVLFPNGTIIIANEVSLINGAELVGDAITIIATKLQGGRVTSNRTRSDLHGGDLFLAIAVINGTAIEANGANGRAGTDGVDGTNGSGGKNGRSGRCDGFGKWESSQAGKPGGNGRDGQIGQDGQNGGDAGNIFILTSYEPTVRPLAKAGEGGTGGRGGTAGRGGPGGRGGSGCTGLGGSQDGEPNGAEGTDGKQGKDGLNGAQGVSKEPTIKMIDFGEVKDAVQRPDVSIKDIVLALRKIQPRAQ